jgi:hypothetical protein
MLFKDYKYFPQITLITADEIKPILCNLRNQRANELVSSLVSFHTKQYMKQSAANFHFYYKIPSSPLSLPARTK